MDLNHHQEEKVNMFDKRNACYDKYHLIFDLDLLALAKKEEIDAVRILLDNAIGRKLIDSSGESPEKKILRDTVTKTLGTKARFCASYFEGILDFDTEKVLLKGKYYYDRKKQGDIVAVLKGVRKILFDNETPLTPYRVNAAWFTLFDGQLNSYVVYKPLPAGSETAKSAADADIDKYIIILDKKYDQLEVNIIDAFETTNPDETGEFVATGYMSSVGVRHNIVDTSAVDKVTLVGINRVLFVITDPATGLEVKRFYTDAHGLAEFIAQHKDLYATVSAPGYITQTDILFKPSYRDTLHLDVQLVKIVPVI